VRRSSVVVIIGGRRRGGSESVVKMQRHFSGWAVDCHGLGVIVVGQAVPDNYAH
jgi:hypothetical protein